MHDWLYAMRKLIIIILFLLILGFRFGETIENEIISDVFIEVVGPPPNYITQYLPLMSDVELINQINNYSNSEFAKLDSHYYPFKYSELLKGTGGEKQQLIQFRKIFDEFYQAKIDKIIIANDLIFRTSDLLFNIDSREENTSGRLQEEEEHSKYVTGATFSLQKDLDIGEYHLLRSHSNDHETEKNIKGTLELGQVEFSRFKFNSDSTRAVFLIRYDKDEQVGWEKRVEVSKSQSWNINKLEITKIN